MTGPNPTPPGDVTGLLLAWNGGDREALEKLVPLVYDELRKRARRALAKERRGHTLQPTALVHEAYMRLVDQSRVPWQDRFHFYAVSARAMRQVLVDHARRRLADKRDGGKTFVPLSRAGDEAATPPPSLDVLALDQALERLASLDPRQAKLVELRVYGGLTIDEAAEALEVSAATVSRDWRHAEAWLHREMAGSAAP
ncbi:MAG: sigma-70 family RNA polymerase sigma factor [Acidobacteria bacterium]|nr:sigma-70 family RNA polymerase sigma factor [Acidobacteriota bacterium]